MNLHKTIRDDLGQEVVKTIRDYENNAKKLERHKNHLRFNLHCKHHDVTPVSLKLTSNVQGEAAERIINRAERSLLGLRIGQTTRKVHDLSKKNENLQEKVNNKLPPPLILSSKVAAFIQKVQLKEQEESKKRQQKKFAQLKEKKEKKLDSSRKANVANECMTRWVENCSNRLLADPELSILRRGLNFAVTPRRVPLKSMIAATESACKSLNESDANELRAKVANILDKNPTVKEQNISSDERKAIKSLTEDDSIVILPADKGAVTVVMDKDTYIEKCQKLLKDDESDPTAKPKKKTYEKRKSNPTARYKEQIVKSLSSLNKKGVISNELHRKLKPKGDQPPRFYGLPKIHKEDMPLRPIVSSIGTITYKVAKHVAEILSPLVGKTEHHVRNSKHFTDEVRKLTLEPDEEIRSYDVTAMFTSVPVDKAIEIIQERLEEDETLGERTTLSPTDIVNLLKLCLKCYFQFGKKFYRQVQGVAMGSPVSPIVCNLFMENFEEEALSTAINPPRWWKRYVDDTYVVLNKTHANEFTDHLNNIDAHIKWTTESETKLKIEEIEEIEERSLPFLDVQTIINSNGSLRTKVYRKPTHTDQYLNFHSNHPLEHKVGVVRTLLDRAETLVTLPLEKEQEVAHVKQVLQKNGYPKWAIEKGRKRPRPRDTNDSSDGTDQEHRVCIPYVRGLSEQLRRMFKSYGVKTSFKPSNTLRQIMVRPKDKLKKGQVEGSVYHIPCKDCDASYIGETGRSLKACFEEHRQPSSVKSKVSKHIHKDNPKHDMEFEHTKILEVEPRWFERGVLKSIHVKSSKPTLNKDGGRFNLPADWDKIIHSRVGRNSQSTTQISDP